MIPHNEWEWFGTAGHYCCANQCGFHLCTRVGEFLISSVGDRPQGQIGSGRLYETAVFRYTGVCLEPDCDCGMPFIIPVELEMVRANSRRDTRDNHMRLCEKYARVQ